MRFEYKGKSFFIRGCSEEDHIYKNICQKGTFYEIDLLEYIAHFMRQYKYYGNIAIDVGANIGNHSIFFQSFLTEYVVAIEPNSIVFPILEENLSGNIIHYETVQKGLGEFESKGEIIIPSGSSNNIGMAKLKVGSSTDHDDVVDITTLDLMIDDLLIRNKVNGDIALIKVDVEGMELSVLKGAEKTIQKYKPHLVVEAATTEYLSEIENYLNGLDYFSVCHYAATPVHHFVHKAEFYSLFRAKVIQKIYAAKAKLKRVWS